MVDEMLNPGEIGIACRRNTILPTGVAAQLVAAPVAVVERRIGHYKIGFHIAVRIVQKRALGVPFHLRCVDAAYGKVHLAQSPGGLVALLSINRYVLNPPLMLLHKLLALYKHSARAAARVKHTAFVRFQHIHQQLNNTARRVELATLLAFGQCKLAKKILENVAQKVGAVGARVLQG